MKKILLMFIATCMLSACTQNQGTFTVISNQVADLDNINLETAQKIRNVEGKSVGQIFILIPVGEMNPNVESAMQDAFTRVDGDIFVNARLSSFGFFFPYIYGRFSQTIEGDVVKTRK